MLWTAIAFSQRTDPNVVSVVYSGDVDASKEIILDKVKASPRVLNAETGAYCCIVPFRHHTRSIKPTLCVSPPEMAH